MITKCKNCGVLFDANANQTECLECFYQAATITVIGYPQPKKPKKPKK